MRPLTLRGRIFLGFAAPLVLVVAAWWVLFGSLVASVRAARSIAAADELLDGMRVLTRTLTDAEEARRASLSSRDPALLGAYRKNADAFSLAAARLDRLLEGRPRQRERLSTMSRLFDEWRGTEDPGAGGSVPPEEGRRLVDEMTAVAAEFEDSEKARIQERMKSVARNARLGTAVALVGPFLALALALWGMLSSTVSIARAVGAVAGAAEGLARGDLSQRVPVTREDEIGKLAGAFNTMAERLERRAREQELLREMGDLLHSCPTMREAFEVAPRILRSLFPGSAGGVLILDAERTALEPVTGWGGPDDGADGKRFVPQDCWALRRGGRNHVSRPDGSTAVCAHVPAGFSSAALCVPLTAQGETLGVLTIGGGENSADFGRESGAESPHGLAEIVAERLALAVANIRLRETLRDQSVRDPLTGVFNRRYMEETLEREIHQAERHGGDLSIVMLDLDHFKSYNDRHGHAAGDALLREVARSLASHLRQGDVACRYGGEEFVLILPGASLDGTLARADKLRETVKQLRVRHRGEELAPATLSLGLASYPLHGASAAALLRAADAALYRAKAAGRDRVEVPA